MGKISSTAGNKIISKIITEVNVEMIDLTKEINISELVIYYQEMKMVIFTLLIELVIHLDGKEKIAPLLK